MESVCGSSWAWTLFGRQSLPAFKKGYALSLHVIKTLVEYRYDRSRSEWRCCHGTVHLKREDDLLEADFALAGKIRCIDAWTSAPHRTP